MPLSHLTSPLRVANYVIICGCLLLFSGLTGAYGLDAQLSIAEQVLAHALVILGPSLIKIGYVMRLLAQQKRSAEVRYAAT
jgi:hypothetical protein